MNLLEVSFDQLFFETPGVLLLLALVPLVVWASVWRRMRHPVGYSGLSVLGEGSRGWRVRLRWVPVALRTAALVLLVLAAARPREGVGNVRTVTNGVAIMAAIDRSLSMTDLMPYGDEQLTRFETVKRVLREFIEGDGEELAGRRGDLIGLVQFARLADTQAPPVSTHDTLLEILSGLELAPYTGLEAGTSIGEALALAAARLETIEDQLTTADERDRAAAGFRTSAEDERDPDFVITSKVVILLTDGDERSGDIPALEAAELCAEWGITVYTIGIGSEGSRYGFDEGTLREIAEKTGGLYRRATDADSLRAVYREIDELEETEVQRINFTTYNEWFHVPLAVGLALLGLEVVLGTLVLRRAA